jgi:hypothetical protein
MNKVRIIKINLNIFLYSQKKYSDLISLTFERYYKWDEEKREIALFESLGNSWRRYYDKWKR